MSIYAPSPAFENAASYLSKASSLSSVSNTIKLELYGLYKYLTVSHAPNTSRPQQDHGERASEAEARYIAIARELGWAPPMRVRWTWTRTMMKPQSQAGGFGFGTSKGGGALSDLAISGNVHELRAYLDANPNVDVNVKDENGYTPLHLACDRGHADVVRLLLERGADPSIKDDDDLTGRELAEISGHDEIMSVLKAA
ncbi:ankyrin repeat-containing domain protein [Fomitopsis serialis]|uniref:ankyrin repeat-containing domain protein n=1 Tax=Fomitopsis serialis TaxID=139415 RepID=UPI002007CCC3|nr:ankyrin repeat-containing domain protein [Neoantrodia serialis]KAH9937194.1 ankyrin repeat-containing domain protein [Neoantrodia serialis]